MYTIYLISIFIYLVCLSVDIADFAGAAANPWADRHEICYEGTLYKGKLLMCTNLLISFPFQIRGRF